VELVIVITSLVSLVVGYSLGKLKAHIFQNRGEATLSRAVNRRFVPPDFHLLNHVTLRPKEGTTQIDHILISRFGVFVIETKDYKGWIFGGATDRYWTQVFFQSRFRFQNPIRQNYRHVCAVRELLDFVPADAIRSAVVFTGDARFKTNVPNGVFTLAGFIAYVESHSREVLPIPRVQLCIGRVEAARLSATKTTDIDHIQSLRNRYGSDA